jgi:uncharacterized protein (TIGR04552 family)
VEAKPPGAKLNPVYSQGIADLAALQMVLAGTSAIDASRAWFQNRESVDDFLRLHQFDTDNPLDLRRLNDLHQEATVYLSEVHGYRLPRVVEEIDEIHDLFLLATHGPRRHQRFACMVLKVMQILHHLACRQIVYETAISEADLFARLNSKVFRVVDEMRAAGIVVDEFATGTKTKDSLVTKLLAKQGPLASQIFDKMRFRLVVHSRGDLVLSLLYLLRHLVPANQVVPGESQNGLITREDVAQVLDIAPSIAAEHWYGPSSMSWNTDPTPRNEFSGSTFRCVNFVADIPIRIDDVATIPPPAIAVVQAEIQLMDAATAVANDQGENAHSLYKKRQCEHVRRRLEGDDID